MCTVTYISTSQGIYITSNRDENIARNKTVKPVKNYLNGKTVVFPKDVQSSGTWIGYNQNNTVAVLLNGAFNKHTKKSNYIKSRGFVIPEILKKSNSLKSFEMLDLNGIEPFTLILYYTNKLYEYRWNEIELFKKELNNTHIHIWNSRTLYTPKMEHQNKLELAKQLAKPLSGKKILQFHQSMLYENQLPNASIRNNIKTVSITQISVQNNKTSIQYCDLLKNELPAYSI
jgi:uncharacterized protein with NRDE domain